MFGQSKKTTGIISGAADRVTPYFDRLAHDEKLHRRLSAAIGGSVAARRRAKRQTGFFGTAARIGANPALRAPVLEAVSQFQKARGRMQKTSHHKTRNSMLALAGAGIVVAVVPQLRSSLAQTWSRKSNRDDSGSGLDEDGSEE